MQLRDVSLNNFPAQIEGFTVNYLKYRIFAIL